MSAPGRGRIAAIVGCALLVLVAILSLVAFFGVRALVPEEQGAPAGATAPAEPAEFTEQRVATV
ncbi:hypothetical protein [Brachybacterium sp. UNK5269]|uniref:hypothetical protein n=1 Tax=Brachybacterium sp. UNK5269 TaxID=3408576 RepID=UPI003BB09B93